LKPGRNVEDVFLFTLLPYIRLFRRRRPVEKKVIQNGKEKTAVIREYKDSVFRMIFKEKIELLSLFNAINNTHYTDPDILEINTLENAVYMSMKNDISCVPDMRMSLFEHQSTINPNMPLRYLMYVSALYEKQIWNKDLYSRKKDFTSNT
jgi:hypothetical protein